MTYIFFSKLHLLKLAEITITKHSICTFGVFSDLWPVVTACGNIHMDILFFFYWQDGWSFSNCAQAETTAELHQGLLLNFLKKTHVLEEKGDGVGWGGRDGNGGRGIGKKKSWKKTWHFCLRWSMLCDATHGMFRKCQ